MLTVLRWQREAPCSQIQSMDFDEIHRHESESFLGLGQETTPPLPIETPPPINVSRLLVSLGVAGALLWGYLTYQRAGEEREKREQAAYDAKDKATEKRVSQLASRYDAVTDWRKSLGSKDIVRQTYSAELTPLFVRSDERPILFIALVRDVSSEPDGYTIHFETQANLSQVKLLLQCTPEQAQLVMSHPADYENLYAVIAQIREVVSSDETVEQGKSRPAPVASGKCIDLMPVGSYLAGYMEMFSTTKTP
jgi:hypothetical protein